MKRETLYWIGPFPVFLVAYNRESRISQLHPDLVPASGLQRQLNKRAASAARQHSIMCNRMSRLRIAHGAMDFEGIGFIEVRFKNPALSA